MTPKERARFQKELRALLSDFGVVILRAPLHNSIAGYDNDGNGMFHIDLNECIDTFEDLKVSDYETL